MSRQRHCVRVEWLDLSGLQSITDRQVGKLSKVDQHLFLNGIKHMTDAQAEMLSNVPSRGLGGLTSITDEQVETLMRHPPFAINLRNVSSITDAQAESLSRVEYLDLSGLGDISVNQLQSLNRVGRGLELSLHCQKRIGEYRGKRAFDVEKITRQLNSTGTITDDQAEFFDSYLCRSCELYLVDFSKTLSRSQVEQVIQQRAK